ncbi:MAG: hypothetical protein JO302_06485 [Candidatus Eremiobacteraeota bacterium]|nr:hypothetical protein [Candidatus Eremiobacteraeota bacterium]
MTKFWAQIALLSIVLCVGAVPALAATPAPSPVPKRTMPPLHLPDVPLHAEYVVEVNKYGQVVRIKSAKPTKNSTFNVQTYGNAMQMWIRHPDGTATVGLFRVTYDYDPKTKIVHRGIVLVSEGGPWANDKGAANAMIDTAKKEALDAQKRHEVQGSSLPSLNEITGKSPTPSPTP